MRGRTIFLFVFLFSLIFAVVGFAQIKRRTSLPAESHPPSSKKILQRGKPLLREVQASDLSIEKVYQKECRLYVGIVNRGKGRVTDKDYRNGKLKVLYRAVVPGAKGQASTFDLSKVDPKRTLKSPGKWVEFNTGITLGMAKIYKVTVKFTDLKDDVHGRGKKWLMKDLILPDSCVTGIRKPATGKPPHGSFPKPAEMKVPLKKMPEGAKTPPQLKQERQRKFRQMSKKNLGVKVHRITTRKGPLSMRLSQKIEGRSGRKFQRMSKNVPKGFIRSRKKPPQRTRGELGKIGKTFEKSIEPIYSECGNGEIFYPRNGQVLSVGEFEDLIFYEPPYFWTPDKWRIPCIYNDKRNYTAVMYIKDLDHTFTLGPCSITFNHIPPDSKSCFGDDAQEYLSKACSFSSNFSYYEGLKNCLSGRQYYVEIEVRDIESNSVVGRYRSGVFTVSQPEAETQSPTKVHIIPDCPVKVNKAVFRGFYSGKDSFKNRTCNLLTNIDCDAEFYKEDRAFGAILLIELVFKAKNGKPFNEVCDLERNNIEIFQYFVCHDSKGNVHTPVHGPEPISKYIVINGSEAKIRGDGMLRLISDLDQGLSFCDVRLGLDFRCCENCRNKRVWLPGKIFIHEKTGLWAGSPWHIFIRKIEYRNQEYNYLVSKKNIKLHYDTGVKKTPGGCVKLYYFSPTQGKWVFLKEAFNWYGEGYITFTLPDEIGNRIPLKLMWCPGSEGVPGRESWSCSENCINLEEYQGDLSELDRYSLSFAEAKKTYPLRYLKLTKFKRPVNVVYVGRPYSITWISDSKSEPVQIDIVSPYEKHLGRVSDTGSYLWTPASEDAVAEGIKIRVKKVGDYAPYDETGRIMVRNIGVKILSPVERSTYQKNKTLQITWMLEAPEYEKRGKVRIYYRVKGEGDWPPFRFIAEVPASQSSYTWIIPDVENTPKEAQIELEWQKSVTRFLPTKSYFKTATFIIK
ncbi:hypothetical protein TST_0739 [Thermosulfidibacter takaii ABI70S6]|uniref:Uncharacterized protein n=1 Tax=Thermosulfidibacter takaii (strain DSM 17441 / JCM 13301 / NBRC 103674 / ABI70S6) TaxID=1298851 RepID=A0A0S3QT86_THET7|nr:hypothetical protein [Thermosulfidibacter takaii]BAT71544.1 hypothetical protein TST_0739 [Thermosulfidibacter takaii ABI70S6]